jgi:hypothetical protein
MSFTNEDYPLHSQSCKARTQHSRNGGMKRLSEWKKVRDLFQSKWTKVVTCARRIGIMCQKWKICFIAWTNRTLHKHQFASGSSILDNYFQNYVSWQLSTHFVKTISPNFPQKQSCRHNPGFTGTGHIYPFAMCSVRVTPKMRNDMVTSLSALLARWDECTQLRAATTK